MMSDNGINSISQSASPQDGDTAPQDASSQQGIPAQWVAASPVSAPANENWNRYVEKKAKRDELYGLARSERGFVASLLTFVFCAFGVETWLLSPAGAGFGLLALCYEIFILIYFKNSPNAKKGAALAAPIVFIGLSFAVHPNRPVFFIALLTSAALCAIQLAVLGRDKSEDVFSGRSLLNALSGVIEKPIDNLGLFFSGFAGCKKMNSSKQRSLLPALVGVLAAVPFAAIIVSQFSRADPIFASKWQQLFKADDFSAPRLIADVALGFISAIFVGSAVLWNSLGEKSEPRAITARISPAAGTAFALVVNAVLAFFAVIQITYLFSGTSAYAAATIGYAEYARQGFFELARVTALVFAAAAVILGLCKNADGKPPLAIRLSVLLMCVCDGIVLASSVLRMLYYIGAYGLSVKRLLTMWLMAVFAAALLFLAIKCALPSHKVLRSVSVSVIVMVCALCAVNTGRLVAEYNANLYSSNITKADFEHMSSLGYTALPDLVNVAEAYAKERPLAPAKVKLIENQIKSFENRRALSATLDDARVAESIDAAKALCLSYGVNP